MVLDITQYDKRRNRRGLPVHGAREANGRKLRSGITEYMVYFVRVDNNPLLKIGRTGKFANRVKAYQDNSGSHARAVFQVIVPDYDASVRVETKAVRLLRARYGCSRREWFDVPMLDVPGLVAEIVATSGEDVVEVRGASEIEREDETALHVFKETVAQAVRSRR